MAIGIFQRINLILIDISVLTKTKYMWVWYVNIYWMNEWMHNNFKLNLIFNFIKLWNYNCQPSSTQFLFVPTPTLCLCPAVFTLSFSHSFPQSSMLLFFSPVLSLFSHPVPFLPLCPLLSVPSSLSEEQGTVRLCKSSYFTTMLTFAHSPSV